MEALYYPALLTSQASPPTRPLLELSALATPGLQICHVLLHLWAFLHIPYNSPHLLSCPNPCLAASTHPSAFINATFSGKPSMMPWFRLTSLLGVSVAPCVCHIQTCHSIFQLPLYLSVSLTYL